MESRDKAWHERWPCGEGKGGWGERAPSDTWQGRGKSRLAGLDLPENTWVYLWNCAAGSPKPLTLLSHPLGEVMAPGRPLGHDSLHGLVVFGPSESQI